MSDKFTALTPPLYDYLVRQAPPLDDVLAGHVEKVRGDLLEVRLRPVLVLLVLSALDLDRTVAGEHHAEPVGERRRFELRKCHVEHRAIFDGAGRNDLLGQLAATESLRG